MTWFTDLPPTLQTVLISALTALLVSFLTNFNSRRINQDKIAADAALAKSKAEADQKLAERKLDFDIQLAERKFAIDQRTADWKRRSDLAEETLANFFKAKSVFGDARRPFSGPGEGSSRPRPVQENEQQATARDALYAPLERLLAEKELFADLQAKKYRMMALFGSEAGGPFDAITLAYNEMVTGTHGLIRAHMQNWPHSPAIDRWEEIIGWGLSEQDRFASRIDVAVSSIESFCAPMLGREVGEP